MQPEKVFTLFISVAGFWSAPKPTLPIWIDLVHLLHVRPLRVITIYNYNQSWFPSGQSYPKTSCPPNAFSFLSLLLSPPCTHNPSPGSRIRFLDSRSVCCDCRAEDGRWRAADLTLARILIPQCGSGSAWPPRAHYYAHRAHTPSLQLTRWK